MPDRMAPFGRTIDAAKKYVVSSTLDRVDWNAELVRGDLGEAVQELKRESGKGLFVYSAEDYRPHSPEVGMALTGVDGNRRGTCAKHRGESAWPSSEPLCKCPDARTGRQRRPAWPSRA